MWQEVLQLSSGGGSTTSDELSIFDNGNYEENAFSIINTVSLSENYVGIPSIKFERPSGSSGEIRTIKSYDISKYKYVCVDVLSITSGCNIVIAMYDESGNRLLGKRNMYNDNTGRLYLDIDKFRSTVGSKCCLALLGTVGGYGSAYVSKWVLTNTLYAGTLELNEDA